MYQRILAGSAVLSAALAAGGAVLWSPLGWLAAPVMLAVAAGIASKQTHPVGPVELSQEDRSYLRDVLDATPFPIAVVDLSDDTISFWSRSALTLFGHTASTTDQWYQLAYPDPDYRREVIERWKPRLEEAKLSGHAVNTGEYQIACRDGSVRICEIYAAFTAGRLIVTFRDITSRKQAEEAASQSDSRLRQLMQQARCLIFEADIEAPEHWRQIKPKCFSWHISGATDSAATENLIDLDCPDPAEFFNVFVSACDPDHRRRMDVTFMEVVLEGWRSYTQEYRVKNRHGQWRWFSETIHLTPLDANHWHAAGTVIDVTDLRRAEDALAAEHQLLSSLISAIPDRVYFKDNESRFIRVNPAFLEFHGVDQQTVLGKTDSDLFGEHARDALADEQLIMATGQPLINKEEREDRSDGRITWALTTKMPLRDAAGDIVGVMGISRDNTEHKRAEQALQESHRKLQQLMQQAHCLIFEAAIAAPEHWRQLKDEEFRFDWQFGAVDVDLARNLIELDYSETPEFFDALDKARGPVEFLRLYNLFSGAVRRDHPSYSHEYRIKNQNGHWQWFSETVHLKPIDGNHWHAAGAIADITDRKLAEDALVAEQKLLGNLISTTPDNVYFKDRQSRFILVNEAHARYCGVANPQAMIGKTDFDLFGSHAAEALADEQRIIATGQPLVGKEECEDRTDGQTAWVLTTKMPLRDSAGEIVGIMGISRNITEHKRAEQQIRQLNEELEQRVIQRTAALETSNRELEAFSYSVSHDLRAPLRHIDGYVQLLSRCREGLGKKDRHYLDTIADSARQMGRLIDDLLQFSRTGRTEMHQAGMDMNQAVQDSLAAVQAGISERTIEWVIADLPHVFGDYAMLRVVWTNLLSNAVKYTQPREQTRIEVGICEENGQQVFFVRDNGVGFDMQHAQNLFGVFQRLHSAESFEGTGIGLATVRRIVARHGGRTWAQAELDKGATIYFALPNATTSKDTCRESSLCTGDKHP